METGRLMYAASSCWPAIQWRSSSSGVATAAGLLNRGDAHAVRAAGRLDGDLVADFVADQRLAHRRFEADASRFRVRFRRADDAVGLLILLAVLDEVHRAAHPDHAS